MLTSNEHIKKINKKQRIVAWVFLIIIGVLIIGLIVSLIMMKKRLVGMFLFIISLVTALAYISTMHFKNQIFWEEYNDKVKKN